MQLQLFLAFVPAAMTMVLSKYTRPLLPHVSPSSPLLFFTISLTILLANPFANNRHHMEEFPLLNPTTFETCKWYGTAPWCDADCPSGTVQRGWDACGDGKCCIVGMKRQCCW